METRNPSDIFSAIEKGKLATVSVLIDNFADINDLTNHKKMTPAQWSLHLKKWNCLELFLRNFSFTATLKTLTLLIEKKQHRLVELFKSIETVMEDTDKDGNIALHHAVLQNDEIMVGILLKYGANPHHKNNANFSPLESACQLNYGNVALCLIQSASFDGENKGEDALLLAIQNQNLVVIKKLLEKGASTARYDCKIGNVFLYEALKKDKVDILKLLLSFMDVNKIEITQEGKTTAQLAFEIGANKCLEWINHFSAQLTPLNLQPDYLFKLQKDFLRNLLTNINHQTWWIKQSDWSLMNYEKMEFGKKWRTGFPEHIAAVKEYLRESYPNNHMVNVNFFKVATIFFDLLPNEDRHPDTQAFDEKTRKEICQIFTLFNQPMLFPLPVQQSFFYPQETTLNNGMNIWQNSSVMPTATADVHPTNTLSLVEPVYTPRLFNTVKKATIQTACKPQPGLQMNSINKY